MKKIEVTYCGMQERIGLSPFLLVTEVESRTTVAYNDEKHILASNSIDEPKIEIKEIK